MSKNQKIVRRLAQITLEENYDKLGKLLDAMRPIIEDKAELDDKNNKLKNLFWIFAGGAVISFMVHMITYSVVPSADITRFLHYGPTAFLLLAALSPITTILMMVNSRVTIGRMGRYKDDSRFSGFQELIKKLDQFEPRRQIFNARYTTAMVQKRSQILEDDFHALSQERAKLIEDCEIMANLLDEFGPIGMCQTEVDLNPRKLMAQYEPEPDENISGGEISVPGAKLIDERVRKETVVGNTTDSPQSLPLPVENRE